MKPFIALRDAVIIFVLTVIGGFVVGVIHGIKPFPNEQFMMLIGACNVLLSIAGFTFSASVIGDKRWSHILLVAFILWPMGLVNLLVGITIEQWILSLLVLLVCMVFGGILSYLFSR